MKLIKIIALVALTMTTTEAVQLNSSKFDTGADDHYLTKVFHKYDQLGLDANGEDNGKRVLTKFNAERAAKEVAAKWHGLSGAALDDFVGGRFGGSWANFGAGDFIDVRDAYYWIRQLCDTDQPMDLESPPIFLRRAI